MVVAAAVKCSSTVLEVMGSNLTEVKNFIFIINDVQTLYYYDSAHIHVPVVSLAAQYKIIYTIDIFIFGVTVRNAP